MKRLALMLVLAVGAYAAVKEFKPSRWNMFSKEQDVELGKEAAEEVRKTMPIVNNSEMTRYLNRIGERLAKSKRAGGFPYTFQIINDPSINAFALPGGPMFVHTGLIAAAENESQLAGVLAHEMSHVSLRHGTTNVSKANLIQLPAMLAGQALGNKGIWGTLGQLGIQLGAGSVLLKYSRDAEKEADLNGAQIMNDAGYNPTAMAIFFDKLNEGGKADDSKLANFLSNFLSDHPTPGNRTKYVNEQNKELPKVQYSEIDPQALQRAKQTIASLPAPPKPQENLASNAGGGAPAGDVRPSGKFKAFSGANYKFNYPDNWEVFGDQNAQSVTVAPRATLVQDQQGNVHVGYGFISAYYFPQDGKPNLQRDTNALLKQMQGANPGMRQTANAKNVKVGGQNGILVPLQSASPYQGQQEIDMLLTVARPEGLFYTVFIAPSSEWSATQPTFNAVVNSLQFTK